MSTFRTKTRIFSSQEALSEMLSYSDFDIRDIGKEKTAVFLKVHDEKTTYHALATIFVKQAYEALIAVAQTCPGLKLPYRTNFILDEFANMPALKDVETMITASRSRNIRFSFVIQNFSQLNKVYGKDVAETIKGNCGNFVYLMSTELSALEEISKLLGDQKPPKAKKDEPAQPIRPLFTVSDLQALKEGEVIINRFRSMPFKTKLTYDWKIDWGKKYEIMQYTESPHHDVKVFDLKGFVTKLKDEQGTPVGGPMGMGGFNSPMGGGMMPGMGGMGMGAPFIPGALNPMAARPASLDEYVKKLDEKIAELEKEEAEEKARIAKEQEKSKEEIKKTAEVVKEKTAEEIQKEINDIFDHKVDEIKDDIQDVKSEVKEDINDVKSEVKEDIKNVKSEVKRDVVEDIAEILDHNATEPEEVEPEVIVMPTRPKITEDQKPTYEELEKPKFNIDVDSVVVNNNDHSEDFFDDFFGGEGE